MYLKLFHLSVFLINSYTLWYDQNYVDLPFPSKAVEDMPFKARQMFLTIWCLLLQAVYFGISFLNDIFGTNATNPKKSPFIRKLKDIVFSLAFPIAIYVSLAFWSFYIVKKDLIFPDEIEKMYPKWVNHVMHTMVSVFICIELLLTKRNYPSRKVGFTLMVTFTLAYTAWIYYLYFTKDVWAYPFMIYFNWLLRIIFSVTSVSFSLVMYFVGEKINYMLLPRNKVHINGKSE